MSDVNRRFAAAGLMRRPGVRGIDVLPETQYLLNYRLADSFVRATEAAFVDPRPVANGGTADVAWGFAASGAAAWKGNNEPRILPAGAYLAEDARENADAAPRDFTTWTESNATETAAQANGPDGASGSAALVEADSASSPKITKATGKSAGALTCSLYVRKASYAGNITLALSGGSSESTTLALSDTWQRLIVSDPSLSGATTVELQLDADASADCHIDLSQFEVSAFATSPIRTPGVATRNKDVMSATGDKFGALFYSEGFAIDIWYESASLNIPLAWVFDAGGNQRLIVEANSGRARFSGRFLSASDPSPPLQTMALGDKVTIRIEYGVLFSLLVNDSATGSVSLVGFDNWTEVTRDIGVRGSGNTPLQGVMSRPRPL